MNTKRKIAVLCAYNDNNLGMYSVDLAAREFFTSLGYEFDLFVAQTSRVRGARFIEFLGPTLLQKKSKRFGQLRYKLLRSADQLADYTHLVFWGDFLNNPIYGKHNFSQLDVRKKFSKNNTEAFEFWKELFSLKHGKPTPKVFSIGNNLQNSFAELGHEAEEILASFRSNFDLFLPRDPFSLENITSCLQDQPGSCKMGQGTDCAFLLDSGERKEKHATFCYHFGRSGFSDTSKLISTIESETGLRAVHLTNWLNTYSNDAETVFRALRRSIAESQFVITDTYHVCVNAMNQSTPVFGIGRDADRQKGTLGDFKKQTLFEMMGLQDFYLTQKGDNESHFLKQVAESVRNFVNHSSLDAPGDVNFDVLNKRVGNFRSQLTDAFSQPEALTDYRPDCSATKNHDQKSGG